VWTKAGLADAKDDASPATAMMCANARAKSLISPARPGAAVVWCGVHVGLLIEPLSGGLWRTIEGNHADQVGWAVRSLDGTTIYVPPGFGAADVASRPVVDRDYLIEDVVMRGMREWGGFATVEYRDGCVRALAARGIPRGELRTFRRAWPNPATPFYVERPKMPPRWYGPWDLKDTRDGAQVRLENSLDRELRPASFVRTNATGADPLGKTT
jgi:hypothetical protein